MPEPKAKILVIDDEEAICRNCEKILSRSGHTVKWALNGYKAMEMMYKEAFDLVITDLKMNSMGGLEVLSRVKDEWPQTQVIVITGYASVSSAVEVMKTGAFDYLPKPFTPDELRGAVRQALAPEELFNDAKPDVKKISRKITTHQLVGDSPQMQGVIRMLAKVAPTDSNVLIYGESGTGKEVIARAIHANSKRKGEVFFAVDCGALAENLLQSELFGHTKGAFTGAVKDKKGIFELADGGTVFLDEVSSISMSIQSNLLRFLETREVLPIGGTAPVKVDVRLIFATNQDLKEMVSQGKLREDFYYRIMVYPIFTPPLRERRADILPIAYHFLDLFSHSMSKDIRSFSPDAAEILLDHSWPGNVRQLRNAIERAVILCEGRTISARELEHLQDRPGQEHHQGAYTITHDYQVPANAEELKEAKKIIRQLAVEQVERDFLTQALENAGGNITRAAEQVGMQRSNFSNLMKKHGVRAVKK
ncbi:DNA-binding transcriptional response regulator, NtrC family, contains REC, AAA-type ATPase, and a Fis-type DNA-binding domains [Desulfatibacillum alkenivorans DSM 16219]|jgi:DNA-binding NtrC family response regulator|uniref:DNA-binding transcriptional response regulator, NtrC family, contains REC, AAA-type ATPase, and a Fis-type DNA-binding domains n=1 Tax=Desulfatibacillum alkenivorans DSM 16219 TaxID=1121393 RepID=A0A1M6BK37_9BACT|nr:sigma-54 dependent transcriptional regulator [Desulfatibacillum alkenivorans]SHI49071.1 DNA-binding transcriptional response regulator, NtrC family, contains REC, AAA-type ATPase, and a Fis-type DNA-binding domains [Desulfatibacillum alkenivorans DSM 16219]